MENSRIIVRHYFHG